MSNEKPVYGIDLGTTCSSIAVVGESRIANVIPNADGNLVTPSVVFFDDQCIIVGEHAKRHALLRPNNHVEMIKRSMGDAHYRFEHRGIFYRPEEISALILKKLIADAEQHTGEKVCDAVISCPAYFGFKEREATLTAGALAGLNVRGIISEPTAAAITYGTEGIDDQVMLVYDLGGGTFDATIVRTQSNSISVMATSGDHNLGGKDWDVALANLLAQRFSEQSGGTPDLLDDPETLANLISEAEELKKKLSILESVHFSLPHHDRLLATEVSRAEFEELTRGLLEQTVMLSEDLLLETGLNSQDLNRILLVGGSTRMPQVRDRLHSHFNVECTMYDPDLAIVKGAALYADLTFRATDANRRQDELVQVTNVAGKTFGILALDESGIDVVFNLIRRNDLIPKQVTQVFGTAEDQQACVALRLMENRDLGEQTEVSMCSEIGSAELHLPPNLPAGSQVEVTFTVDQHGRLSVAARELSSGLQISIDTEVGGVLREGEREGVEKKSSSNNIA